jgi:hypothetical protein
MKMGMASFTSGAMRSSTCVTPDYAGGDVTFVGLRISGLPMNDLRPLAHSYTKS